PPSAEEQPARLVRLNPSIQPVLDRGAAAWTAPPGLTNDELAALMELPAALVTDEAVAMVKALGRKWIDGLVPNEPIRRGDNLECLVGDATFQTGREHWRALRTT